MKTNGELTGPLFAQKTLKYIVLKLADIGKYLEFRDQQKLEQICQTIEKGRLDQLREPDPKYIVCNQDEPYAEVVWQIILYGENMKEQLKKEIPIECADCGMEKCAIKTLKLKGNTFPSNCKSYFKKVK